MFLFNFLSKRRKLSKALQAGLVEIDTVEFGDIHKIDLKAI